MAIDQSLTAAKRERSLLPVILRWTFWSPVVPVDDPLIRGNRQDRDNEYE